MHDVLMISKEKGEHPHALDRALHIKQHALYVGMLDNRHFRCGGVQDLCDMGALDAVPGISDGVHVGGAGNGLGLNTCMDSGRVHELKHDLHAFAFFAQKIADTLAVVAEIQRRGGVSLQSHLMFDARADHVVALAQRSVFIDQELRHDKNGNSLRPFRIAFNTAPEPDG